MSQISALITANSLPQLALPLIESASVQSEAIPSPPEQLPSPPPGLRDTVTISPEAAALQEKKE